MREIGPAPVSRAVELALRGLAARGDAPWRARCRSSATARRPTGSPRWPACGSKPPAARWPRCAAPGSSTPGDGEIAFAHPILGRAIYEELDAGERAAAHRARGARPARRRRARRARRGARAEGRRRRGPDGRRRAARGRRRRAAPRRAASRRRSTCAARSRSRTTPGERAEVLAELGRAEAAAAEPAAADRLREAIATILGGPERRARRSRASSATSSTPAARSPTRPRRSTARWPSSAPARRRCTSRSRPAGRPRRCGTARRRPQIRARVEPLVAPRRRARRRRAERDLLANLAGLEMLAGDDREGATARARRAWGDGAMLEQGGLDDPAIWAVDRRARRQRGVGRARRVLDAVADAATRAGAVLAARDRGLRARVPLDVPRRDRRRPRRDRPDARGPRLGWGTFVPSAIWVRVRCLLRPGRGRGGRGDRRGPARRRGRASAARPLALALLGARASVQLARNDNARRARDVARGGRARRRRSASTTPAFFPWRPGAALAAARLGEIDEAAPRSPTRRSRAARAQALPRTLGRRAHGPRNRRTPARRCPGWRRPSPCSRTTPARLDLARALVQQGTALRVAGPARSTPASRCAAGSTSPTAAAPRSLAARARDELVAAGGRPRRTRLSGAPTRSRRASGASPSSSRRACPTARRPRPSS